MTPKLTDEQLKAMRDQPDAPVKVVDETTNKAVWLISDVAFQRVRPLIDPGDGVEISETYAAQDQIARNEGWDDTSMDIYNNHPSIPKRPA